MGNAIASLFARAGWRVVLIDPSEDARNRSRQHLLGGSTDPALGERLTWHAELESAHACTLVIEAAPENLVLKQRIFASLEAICSPQTIIATNTSGLSISRLAESLQRPERFVGTHFFTPAEIIPLVEVVGGARTDDATITRVLRILRDTGKRPVHVRKDIPGFIANRLQHALAREAMALLQDGVASAEDIDTVARWALGIRLALTGPLEQRDLNGLDIHLAIAEYLYPDLENSQTPLRVLREKVEQGDLGVKSGRGFYDWNTPERRQALRDKETALRELAAHLETKP